MAISARSRRGTSASFWRNHNAMQMMLAQACMPSLRTIPPTKAARGRTRSPGVVSYADPAPTVSGSEQRSCQHDGRAVTRS